MLSQLRANLWLLALTVITCCVLYPGALLLIGQLAFHEKAEGSLVSDGQGRPIGSRLIAQPFSGDEYFQPRPSAVSFNAAASGGSNWAANNYLLRDRVARLLGPLIKYGRGPHRGQPVGPDVELWFRQDHVRGKSGMVREWATEHPIVAQNWVAADKLHQDFVAEWQKSQGSPGEPRTEDNGNAAVAFFTSFSQRKPGLFPIVVERRTADGKTEKSIAPGDRGAEIQSVFFDMWLQEHDPADLQAVPADMVMASGSGLDPHITLKNALYQLDRVAAKWAAETKRDSAELSKEIEGVLRNQAQAPLGGLVGVDLVNVLEVNLDLRERYRAGVQAP